MKEKIKIRKRFIKPLLFGFVLLIILWIVFFINNKSEVFAQTSCPIECGGGCYSDSPCPTGQGFYCSPQEGAQCVSLTFQLVGNENLRECPSFNCSIVKNGTLDGVAEIKEKSGEWYKVIVAEKGVWDKSIGDYGGIRQLDQSLWITTEGWFNEILIPESVKQAFISSQQQNQGTTTNKLTQKEESKIKLVTFLSFFKNKDFQKDLIIFLIVLIVIIVLFLLRKNIGMTSRSLREIVDLIKNKIGSFMLLRPLLFKKKNKGTSRFKSSKSVLSKIKFKQKSFVASLPIILVITVGVAGISFGAVEYKKTSDLVKVANQLIKEEKYNEANDKLGIASMGIIVKTLGIKKQEINNQIEENKKLAEDKSSYDKGLNVLSNNNFQEAINILSTLPEDSFYYQKAQTKIEESRRIIVEGKLSVETTAKLVAEAKAKQEEFEKKLKTQELADKEAAEKMMNADNDGDGLTYRRELELGTSDWDTDSDDDGIIDSKDTSPTGGGREMPQYFSWCYGGYDWTWTIRIHEDWFDYYKAKNPRPKPTSADYVTYNDPFIMNISEKISEAAKNNNLCVSCLVASFIHSLSYIDDKYTGYDEYPKYPVETIIEKNGDCEDTSYLLASITKAMNIDTVLILLPGHMAIGVWMNCGSSGTYYKLGDRCYYYIETTNAKDWSVGEMPSDAPRTPATLIKIPSGEVISNISPQYIKPCIYSSDFHGYYTDGENFYSDSQCNNLTYCLLNKELYYNIQTKSFYWNSSCSQIVVKGCSKSTSYPGYFYNSIDLYSDSRCIQKATICRSSPNYSDTYYDGYNEFWDSNCNQKVVLWCPKSTYYPGYFYNSINQKIYVDSQCTILKR